MLSLIADSSSEWIKIGIFQDDKKLFAIEKEGMALENFFNLLAKVCDGASVKIAKIDEFIFCEGTGSVLGIRCASVSFFTFAYLSNAKIYSYNIFDIARNVCTKQNILNCQKQMTKINAKNSFENAGLNKFFSVKGW